MQLSAVLPSPALTRLAVDLGIGQPQVADMIAPVALVDYDNFQFATFGREDLTGNKWNTKTAPGQSANEVDFTKTWTSATVVENKLKTKIPDTLRKNDFQGTIEISRTKKLTNMLMLGRESRVAALYQAATKTVTALSTKLDNATPPDVILLVEQLKRTFAINSGMQANTLIIPPIVRPWFFNNTTLRSLIQYVSDEMLKVGFVTPILGLNAVIPGALQNTANPGATASISEIWGADELYLTYVDPNAGNDLEALTSVRQVRSRANSAQGLYVKKWRTADESAESDEIGVFLKQIELTIAPELILRQLDVLT